MFEVFIGKNKQGKDKKYIVVDYSAINTLKKCADLLTYCKRFFKCSEDHLRSYNGYVYKDGLYFDNPAIPGAKLVVIVTYAK